MKHVLIHKKNQSGQAIVLIAMLIVALIASLGLAVDGGGMFFLYRDVQNATDASALSAAFALCTGDNPAHAGAIAAEMNGFVDGVDDATVEIISPPPAGEAFAGNPNYVWIHISSIKPSYFIQVVYSGPLKVEASAISQCQDNSNFGWPDNSAIVSLSQSCAASAGSSKTSPVRVTGGSSTTTVNGGIYINTASGACPDAASTDGSKSGLNAGGYGICSDESYDGNVVATQGGTLKSPCPEYDQITDPDPLVTAGLTAPNCSGGSKTLNNGINTPGNYSSFDVGPGGSVYLEPGIYCITDSSVNWKGDIESDRADGVFLYFNGSQLDTLSQPDIQLYAISSNDSDYKNLLMWFDTSNPPENSNDLNLSAGSILDLEGTIYAPRHHCNLAGSGSGTILGQIICYSSDNNGNGPVTIIFSPGRIFQIPPEFGMTE